MAKGYSTQEELRSSLTAVGGLKSLVRGDEPARDSPFGRDHAKGKESQPIEASSVDRGAKRKQQTSRQSTKARANAAESESSKPRQSESGGEVPSSEAQPSRRMSSSAGSPSSYSEKVSVPMTQAMRDEAEALARTLERSARLRREPGQKRSRITANSVYRAAVMGYLEAAKFEDEETPTTEEELIEAARRLFSSFPTKP